MFFVGTNYASFNFIRGAWRVLWLATSEPVLTGESSGESSFSSGCAYLVSLGGAMFFESKEKRGFFVVGRLLWVRF